MTSLQKLLKNAVLLSLSVCLFVTSGCTLPFLRQEKPPIVSDFPPESILIGNEIRTQTRILLESAQNIIYIEQMTISDSELLSQIIAKAHAGVEVRILLDQWQRENSKTVDLLKNENVSVQYYPTARGQFHRAKFMIIDHKIAVFYSAPWTTAGFNSAAVAFKITGSTVQSAAELFGRDWSDTTTLTLTIPKGDSLWQDNITLARTNIKNQILTRIKSASADIWIETQQLSGDVDDQDIINALVAARQRGCRVRLILDPACAQATPMTIQIFADAGIEYRYYKGPNGETLGRNFGIFDGTSFIHCSSAWTHYTIFINHECSLTIPSPQATQKMMEIFQADWDFSAP